MDTAWSQRCWGMRELVSTLIYDFVVAKNNPTLVDQMHTFLVLHEDWKIPIPLGVSSEYSFVRTFIEMSIVEPTYVIYQYKVPQSTH